MFTTSGTYPWSFVTQIFHNVQPSASSQFIMNYVATPILTNIFRRDV